MDQLVLFVVAGITGLIVYSKVAKIEKRFSRGPLGVPAFAWGFVGFIAGVVVGALLGAEVVVAALIGFVAYTETAKHEKEAGAAPFGIPPLAWGIFGAGFGLIGALVEPTFPIWLGFGFAAYREATMYETQYGKPTLRASALVWGVCGFCFGLVGGLVAPALVWTAVCAFLALVGAYVLLLAERNTLLTERNALVAEKSAKANPTGPVTPTAPAPAPARSAPVAAARPGGFTRDLLPRKR